MTSFQVQEDKQTYAPSDFSRVHSLIAFADTLVYQLVERWRAVVRVR